MKTTIKKMFFAWQSDEEEQWLNEMSAKGMDLVSVGFGKYVFEEGVPGRYQYRLEMLDYHPKHAKSIKYVEFLEETGIESIDSLNRWVYFRKKREDGPFDLFSDVDSKIRHFRRILTLLIGVTPLWVIAAFSNFFLGISERSPFNILISLPLFVMGTFILVGGFKIYKKMQYLKKERVIHE